MILWRQRFQSTTIYIGSVTFLLVLVGFRFTLYPNGPQAFMPVIGMAVLWVMFYGRNRYAPLLWGAFLGQFFARMFLLGQSFPVAVAVSFLLSVTLLVVVELFVRMIGERDYLALYDRFFRWLLLQGLGVILAVSIVGALMHYAIYVLFGLATHGPWVDGGTLLAGVFFSVLLLMPLGFLSHRYDAKTVRIQSRQELLFTLAFILSYALVMVVLLTAWWEPFSFGNDYYMMLLFYVLIGVLFSIRTIGVFSFSLLLGASFYVNAQWSTVDVLIFYVNLLLFVTISHGLTLGIIRHKHMREGQQQEITEKNLAVDQLLDDVYALLKFSKDMIRDHSGTSLTREFSRALDIAKRLVEEAKAGYCYVEEDGHIDVLRADVYATTRIPFMYECHHLAEQSSDAITILQNVNATFATIYGEAFMALQEPTPLQSRAIIQFKLSNNLAYYVVVDKTENIGFSSLERDNIQRFFELFQSLFVRNHLATQSSRIKEEIAVSFVRTLDLFDAYTKGHSEDVAALSVRIAEALEVPESERDELYWAGLLHDIGKVGVSAAILNKKSSLTPEEYASIKAHVHYGFDTIGSQQDLRRIALLVRHHHEWHNGKGYPDGLKGEDIPLGARIIAVADAITTMATNRSYRRRLSKSAIIEEIERMQGTQFCPTIAKAALALLQEGWLESHYGRSY